MSPWVFVIAAVVANVGLNLCLKRISGFIALEAPLETALRVLAAPAFWLAGLCGAALVGCFVMSLKGLALSTSYAAVTSLAMVSLAVVGLGLGTETLPLGRALGLGLVVGGVVILGLHS
jgi:multidrug transporter EmrE-like cation transporter